MKEIVLILSGITAITIVLYWVLVFTKVFKVTELTAGYRNWFMPFAVADTWIGVCALLTAFFLSQNDQTATIFGLLTGSSLVFLGLYALSYGFVTRLIFRRTTENVIEVIIKLYCLIAGIFFIIYFS